eukprot:553535_1
MGTICCESGNKEELEKDSDINVEWLKFKVARNEDYFFDKQDTFEIFICGYFKTFVIENIFSLLYVYCNTFIGHSYLILPNHANNIIISTEPITVSSLTISENCSLTVKPLNEYKPQTRSLGVIQIKAFKKIEIYGKLHANAKGYYDRNGEGAGGRQFIHYGYDDSSMGYGGGGGFGTKGSSIKCKDNWVKGGKIYGEATLNKLYYGSPGGLTNNWVIKASGGGIIELIAEHIINYGIISCNGGDQGGSGGSIKIVCKYFDNYGKVLSKGGGGYSTRDSYSGTGGDGRICILCDNFVNDVNGEIDPKPHIEAYGYSTVDKIDWTPIAILD